MVTVIVQTARGEEKSIEFEDGGSWANRDGTLQVYALEKENKPIAEFPPGMWNRVLA